MVAQGKSSTTTRPSLSISCPIEYVTLVGVSSSGETPSGSVAVAVVVVPAGVSWFDWSSAGSLWVFFLGAKKLPIFPCLLVVLPLPLPLPFFLSPLPLPLPLPSLPCRRRRTKTQVPEYPFLTVEQLQYSSYPKPSIIPRSSSLGSSRCISWSLCSCRQSMSRLCSEHKSDSAVGDFLIRARRPATFHDAILKVYDPFSRAISWFHSLGSSSISVMRWWSPALGFFLEDGLGLLLLLLLLVLEVAVAAAAAAAAVLDCFLLGGLCSFCSSAPRLVPARVRVLLRRVIAVVVVVDGIVDGIAEAAAAAAASSSSSNATSSAFRPDTFSPRLRSSSLRSTTLSKDQSRSLSFSFSLSLSLSSPLPAALPSPSSVVFVSTGFFSSSSEEDSSNMID
mmetsp:Transcript_6226/g.15460  ORF Transcript_6226/g.15460 Transcript_6226/m.15460 type:complete len:393 (-) Transcript_6226:192-1370(-)